MFNGKTLLDWMCPVGTIVETDSEEHPVDTYGGGEWIKIEGRTIIGSGTIEPNGSEVVEGSTTALSYTVGDKPNAGLPDVVGTLGSIRTRNSEGSYSGFNTYSGAFTRNTISSNRGYFTNTDGTDGGACIVDFKASSSNSIYGSSKTVQMNSYVTNIWKRIA